MHNFSQSLEDYKFIPSFKVRKEYKFIINWPNKGEFSQSSISLVIKDVYELFSQILVDSSSQLEVGGQSVKNCTGRTVQIYKTWFQLIFYWHFVKNHNLGSQNLSANFKIGESHPLLKIQLQPFWERRAYSSWTSSI